MKVALVFCALLSLAVSEFKFKVPKDVVQKWEDMIHPYRSKCICESGVDEQAALTCLETMVFPTTHEFKCYTKCLYEGLGFIDAQGEFQIDVLHKVNHALSKTTASACSDKVSTEEDLCERVSLFITCAITDIAADIKKQNELKANKN